MEMRINPKYIGTPFRIPVTLGVVLWLLLDRLEAGGVWCGVAWTIYGLLALGCAVVPFTEQWGAPRIEPE